MIPSKQFGRGDDLDLPVARLGVYQIYADSSRPVHQVLEIPAQENGDAGNDARGNVAGILDHGGTEGMFLDVLPSEALQLVRPRNELERPCKLEKLLATSRIGRAS